LIFVLYKKEATQVENFLKNHQGNNKTLQKFPYKSKVTSLHGDMSQFHRTQSFNEFKTGKLPLLIATDVASRGLDLPDVTHVINFSFPLTIEDYVHRIGRTGRAGKTGISHTLFTKFDKCRAGELIEVLKSTSQQIPTDLLQWGEIKRKQHKMYGLHYRDDDRMPSEDQRKHIKFNE